MRKKLTEKEEHKLINLQVSGVGGLNIFFQIKLDEYSTEFSRLILSIFISLYAHTQIFFFYLFSTILCQS